MVFKRNSDFLATVIYNPVGDDPSTLSGITVTSSFEDENGNKYAGTVSVANDYLSFTVSLSDTYTAVWPLGHVLWDVKFVNGSTTFYSATETLEIIKNITP